ncbi:MAG: hypothetical protein ACRDZ9_09430, partial [Acidimicrobiales bacterium]
EWTSGKLLWESGRWEIPFGDGIPIPPFTVNYENVSHLIVVTIYGVFLGMHVMAWFMWQNRAKPKPLEIPASQYGRPLVKQG